MAERRERILDAAREIIGERGYGALTMRDLARTSRVTVPTIYNLVGGKEDVLFAAVEDQTQRFVASIARVRAEPAAARVLGLIEASCRELLRAPRYYRALLPLLMQAGAADTARAAVGQALGSQLRLGLEELERSGELAPWVDPDALLERLFAHLTYTSLQWAGGELGRKGLRAASVYGACLLLAAASTGASRAEFERACADAQPRARSLRRPAARSRNSAAGGGS